MKKIMFRIVMLSAIALAFIVPMVLSEGYGKLEVEVKTINQSPQQFLMPGDPNLTLLPEEKRNRTYSFVYFSDEWFEKHQLYLQAHPNDAILMTSSGGSDPSSRTLVFSNRKRPDDNFFRQ